MEHSLLGDDHEGFRGRVPAIRDHLFGGADLISKKTDHLRALGMGDHKRFGMFSACPFDAVPCVFHVDIAASLPEIHGTPRLFGDPGAKILIRDKENGSVRRCCPDDVDGIAAGADDIGQGLHPRAAIDVGDDIIVF